MLPKCQVEDSIVVKTLNLRKEYVTGKEVCIALRGVSLTVKRGELVSIVGPSGSGKSTLLNLLGALDRPTSGKVFIDGVDIYKLSDRELAELRNRKIGFVFQAFNLIPRLTALDNVQLPLLIQNVESEERKKRAINMLKAVGLGDKLYRKPSELSGGEQQRVAIARALVTNPSIILGDEITGNLDSKTTQEIVELLHELNKKFNTTFIIVTHNMEVANQTHRIIRLRDGLIEKDISLEKPIF